MLKAKVKYRLARDYMCQNCNYFTLSTENENAGWCKLNRAVEINVASVGTCDFAEPRKAIVSQHLGKKRDKLAELALNDEKKI